MGEASNLSQETGKGRIDFLRGNRDGMLGENSKGTWESLPYTPMLYRGKVETYNPYGEGVESREAVGGVHSSEENRDNKTLYERRNSALTNVFKERMDLVDWTITYQLRIKFRNFRENYTLRQSHSQTSASMLYTTRFIEQMSFKKPGKE